VGQLGCCISGGYCESGQERGSCRLDLIRGEVVMLDQ